MKNQNLFSLGKPRGAIFPALALGINDIAGTGFYSGEYLVSSYEYGNFDFNLGLGWGNLNGKKDFENPLITIDERFKNRPEDFAQQGGQFQPSRYFSDENISVFFGAAYLLNEKTIFKTKIFSKTILFMIFEVCIIKVLFI